MSYPTSALLAVIILCATQLPAQTAAPIPAPILAARKVFIANAGADALVSALDRGNDASAKYYNQFYAAMKNWSYYELLSSPADADLVLEIYASAPVESVSNGKSRLQPQFQVSIFDCKTHFLLWRLTESVDAFEPGTFGGVKNSAGSKFDTAVDGIIRQLKTLTAPSTRPNK
jgi:hypothetical protein